MNVDSATLLFFDASCLIAAAASPNGGSGFLWSLCVRGMLTAAVSQPVLVETEANLLAKFPAHVPARHRIQFAGGLPLLAPVPRLDVHPRRYPTINSKDEHVIAAAPAISADHILTLDRPLADEINGANLAARALTPGEFIKTGLPAHPAFARLRD
ncbi:MAG: PIN domain-containing protein [Thermomicrobiales bacterium]